MTSNYTIDKKNKTIKADIRRLTDKALKEVEKYARVGYSVIDEPKETKETITKKFIKENVSAEIFKIFEEYQNEKNLKPKSTNKQKKPIMGYLYALSIFKKSYEWDEEKEKFNYIKPEGRKENKFDKYEKTKNK